MVRLSEKAGYNQVLVGSIQELLPNISERFDHISWYLAIHLGSSFEPSIVLSGCFQKAKSVNIGVDVILDAYNDVNRSRKEISRMTSINHVQKMRDFGIPVGWKVALEKSFYSWNSPSTGVDVFTAILHYERDNSSP
ncbi:hypothetical protein FQN49_004698 [Arthroderma sp. PD_2]|nr:hypothetical protein FQN49_004698 [Arthroderma sp. PD_2]